MRKKEVITAISNEEVAVNSSQDIEVVEQLIKYVPTEEAIKKPRWIIRDGAKIAIGGTILMEGTPPEIPYTIPEATPEQYAQLYKKGYRHLIKEA